MKKILIGMPSGSGQVPVSMVQSLLQLHKPYPCAFMSVERQRTDKARNAIALEALRNDFDYLFFVDDDNPIPEDTLDRFIEDDKDVVVAPILGRNPDKDGNYSLCAFYAEEVEGLRIYRNVGVFRDEGPLHKIDGAGTGAMLIKREVLVKLHEKYQDLMFEFGDIKLEKPIIVDGNVYKRRTMSEDCEFSERAIDAGFEIWLDERVRPVHISGVKYIQWQRGM
jgi:hypothetical protein